jgi:hypothetical protein
MTYGSQGIQQQRGAIEIATQERIQPRKYRKGTESKACETCGKEFTVNGRNRSKRFCQASCKNEESVKRWIECSKCMAAIGLGSHTVSKLLGIVHNSNVSRVWKRRGIKCAVKGGKLNYAPVITKKRNEEVAKFKDYESAWMKHEINAHKKAAIYPDWSRIWSNELAMRKYYALDGEAKRRRSTLNQESRRKRFEENPERKKEYMDRINAWKRMNKHVAKNWRVKNKAKLRQYQKNRIKNNPALKARENMRNRFKDLMRTVKNGGAKSFSELIGCTTSELAKHLEGQFSPWMTWENYGKKWHVDHIIPVASFDQTCPKQRKICWHFSNLRPLGAVENMRKGARITEPQMNLALLVA